jgi:hypothetical protein
MGTILRRGLQLASYKEFPLQRALIPKKFKHILNILGPCKIKKYRDFDKLPTMITGDDGTIYESILTCVGREHPQGWGRLRGPESEPEPDGKVDVFQYVRNEARIALDGEICGDFEDWLLKQRMR